MGFFAKRIDQRIAAYQHELIETHYLKSIICIGKFAVGGMITVITSRP